MDMTIDEPGEHKFAAGVNHFCPHAAAALNFWIVSDGNDLSSINCHGLGPRLLGVFRINAAVYDDDIGRFDYPALRPRYRGSDKQKGKCLENGAKGVNFHGHLVLILRMLAAY
jgi:hypothetical protein